MRCKGEGRGASVRAVHLPRRYAWLAAPRRPLWRASLWAPSEGTAAPPERDETPWGEEKHLCDTDSRTHWYMWRFIINGDRRRLLVTAAIAQLRIFLFEGYCHVQPQDILLPSGVHAVNSNQFDLRKLGLFWFLSCFGMFSGTNGIKFKRKKSLSTN